jgi:hypothetical protein
LLQLLVAFGSKVSLLKGLSKARRNFAALGKLQYNTAVTQGEERNNRGRKKEMKK